MTVRLKLHHLCSSTAEGLERVVNYYVEHSEHYVQSIDTSFDGNMFNAYLKIEVLDSTPPATDEKGKG